MPKGERPFPKRPGRKPEREGFLKRPRTLNLWDDYWEYLVERGAGAASHGLAVVIEDAMERDKRPIPGAKRVAKPKRSAVKRDGRPGFFL